MRGITMRVSGIIGAALRAYDAIRSLHPIAPPVRLQDCRPPILGFGELADIGPALDGGRIPRTPRAPTLQDAYAGLVKNLPRIPWRRRGLERTPDRPDGEFHPVCTPINLAAFMTYRTFHSSVWIKNALEAQDACVIDTHA